MYNLGTVHRYFSDNQSFVKMNSGAHYEICELPEDERVLSGRKYRTHLYYVAQSAIWIGCLYFVVRFVALVSSPTQTWQMWAMFLVELVFAGRCCDESTRERAILFKHSLNVRS